MTEKGQSQAVSLACSQCGTRNYKTRTKPGKVIELSKFCKQCKAHTLHRSAK